MELCTADIIAMAIGGLSISLTTWLGVTIFRGNNGKTLRDTGVESARVNTIQKN